MSTRTIALTLRPTPDQAAALERLQDAFAAACNHISTVAWTEREFNKVRLQRLVYYDVRARFGLLAQHAIRAIAIVADSYKTDRTQQHTFRPAGAVVLDTPRQYRVGEQGVSLATLNGRLCIALGTGEHQRQMLEGALTLAEADLVRDHTGRWRLLVSAQYPDPPLRDTQATLGVDLGWRDIAHTSEDAAFSGGPVQARRDHYARVRRSMQKKAAKGTRSTRRRCRALQRRLSRRERRFQRDINHLVSRRIVQSAQASGCAIALEDLTGIRERTNGQRRTKKERGRSNGWAFAQLRAFVAYKARTTDVPLVVVPAAYTSQTCHVCLHIGARAGKRFRCVNPCCCWCGDADLNAARMIARVGDSVMVPGGPGLSCSLDSRAATSLRAVGS